MKKVIFIILIFFYCSGFTLINHEGPNGNTSIKACLEHFYSVNSTGNPVFSISDFNAVAINEIVFVGWNGFETRNIIVGYTVSLKRPLYQENEWRFICITDIVYYSFALDPRLNGLSGDHHIKSFRIPSLE